MIPVAEFPAQGVADQRSLVADVLHKLSQPLTALQCSLELSLVRDQTSEEFRTSVEAALQNAERLRENLLLLRELSDADDPGDTTAPVELQRLLLEWREDFLPVFESAGGCFHVNCAPVQVRGNEAKLRRAFFYLLEYLLGSSHYRSLNVDVEHTKGRQVDIRMTFSSAASSAGSTHDASESILIGQGDIACRTFRAVGGDLAPAESGWGQTVWIASLPIGE